MRNLSISLFAIVALLGCGGAPPPAGWTLAVQFTSVNPDAIDTLRITIEPRTDGAGEHDFMDIDPTPYFDGGVTVDVEDDGVLVMTITGDYVRDHLVIDHDVNPRFEIEIWSDDEGPMREGPQVRATVTRATEQIASGATFLPTWPLPLGGEGQINVPCLSTATLLCANM